MFAASKTASVSGGYQISRSLRFNSADTAYLSRTPASAGNQKTWTFSTWFKRGSTSANVTLLSGGVGGGLGRLSVFIDSTGYLISDLSGTGTYDQSSAVYRDPSAWYHFVWQFDTTQATAANRSRMYINGVQVTLTQTRTFTQNTNYEINNNVLQTIGTLSNATGTYNFDGYQTETNFIDGQALTPSSFGETNAQTGVWTPKAYSGSYGTNGFYLNFSDNSNTTAATLGKDYSGNGNNWTPNNFSVTAGAGNDSLVDSPTSYGTDTGVGGTVRGNYSTFNPVGLGGGTLTNGNLDLSTTVVVPAVGTMAMTTGKWYWEITNNSVSAPRIGVYNIGAANPADLGNTANGWCLLNGPSRTYTGGSAVSYGSYSPTTGTVVMVAYDADAGKLWFGQDGTWFASGNPATGTSPSLSSVTGSAIVPAIANGNSGTDTFSANFGQRPFAYTAPSGYKALCTQNLPTPTIGATSTTLATSYFNPVLYTGTGATRTVTGVNFSPDLVWIKSRSAAYNNRLYDKVRGVENVIQSNSTAAEASDGTGLTAFGSDGFTLGSSVSQNENASTFVSWNWKANGSGSTNTAGTITSTVSANTTAGFSIVTYTGTGANATVGHGLGATPKMIIGRSRTTSGGWPVYHASLSDPRNNYLVLNLTDAVGTASNYWGTASPTSTTFSLSTYGGNNNTGDAFVMYCFAEVAGYSKFGSYTGNGSSDGTFVYTGFRPAYVLIKRTTSAYNWWILDAARGTINAVKGRLYADASDAESTTYPYVDFLSNGFKLRDADGGNNASGEPYIYACFASAPFKYSLAR